jgi:hypothetical protein
LPAVEVVTAGEDSKRVGYVPHATMAGWLSAKELVIVENGVLVVYTPSSGARRKSAIRVSEPGLVFVR